MYEVSFNIYQGSKKNEECKPIKIDDKEIYLSVGGYLSMGDMPYTLLIHVHYDEDECEELTANIPELKSFRPYIAINPDFKDEKLVEKLKDLSILSDTIETITKDWKEYKIVEVNVDKLKEYKPFGDSILKDYKNNDKGLDI